MKLVISTVAIAVLICQSVSESGAQTLEEYTGDDGVLSKAEVATFLADKDGITLREIRKIDANPPTIENKVLKRFEFDLIELEEIAPPPYTPDQIRKWLKLPVAKSTPDDSSIKGLIGEPFKKGDFTVGPIKLRNSLEDWDKPLNTVSGASVTFSRNRLKDTDTWLSRGSLVYPILRDTQQTRETTGKTPFHYQELAVLPAVSWNLVDPGGRAADVEELNFQVPIFFRGLHDVDSETVLQWRSDVYLAPYYLTDFSLDGGVVGGALTYEPKIQIGRRFETLQWHSLTGSLQGPAYLFRIIPKLEYNEVVSESQFIQRGKNEDMFAVGTSVELAIRPFGKSVPWEVRGKYGFLYDFEADADEHRDIWEIQAIYWLNENAGINFSMQQGETLIGGQEIDMFTAGFQLRF